MLARTQQPWRAEGVILHSSSLFHFYPYTLLPLCAASLRTSSLLGVRVGVRVVSFCITGMNVFLLWDLLMLSFFKIFLRLVIQGKY